MNRRKLFRRVGVVTVLLGLLLLGTAVPVMPAAPLGGTVGLTPGSGWAGHSCTFPVDVTLSGDLVDIGGYETQLDFDSTYFGYTEGNDQITLTDFLADGATRSTSGDDGTPLLEAGAATNVKFGDYSWGTSAGADADGSTLATVGLDIVACGSTTLGLSLSDTQIVDYQGNVLDVDSVATGVAAQVKHQFDTNGDGLPFITGQDVTEVVNNLGTWGGACSAGYQYDTNLDGLIFITGQDVTEVVNNLGLVSCP